MALAERSEGGKDSIMKRVEDPMGQPRKSKIAASADLEAPEQISVVRVRRSAILIKKNPWPSQRTAKAPPHKQPIRTCPHLHTNRIASPQASDCVKSNTPGSGQKNVAKKSSMEIEHRPQSSNMQSATKTIASDVDGQV